MSRRNRRKIRKIFNITALLYLLAIAMVFICETADARAGGGHSFSGGGGGGSHGGGGGGNIYFFIRLIQFSIEYPAIGVPLLIVVVAIAIYGYKCGDDVYVSRTIIKGSSLLPDVSSRSFITRLTAKDPGFSVDAFKERIKKAFSIIQNSWQKRDLSKAEAFLSDGTYEQFLIQINSYKERHLIDVMENLKIKNVEVLSYESDSRFDSVHIAITASAKNYRADERTKSYIEGDRFESEFTEVWTFLRRTGAKTLGKPGLIEGFCPNCGTPISMGRHAKCASCGSVLRSGEHDWVLTNITQASEWATKSNNDSIPGYGRFIKKDPGFNIQHLEDRISVMFWRKIEAERTGKVDVLRKVATNEFCDAQKEWYQPDNSGARKFYDDCAVGAIQVLAVDDVTSDAENYVFARITWSGVPSKKTSDGKIASVVNKTVQKNVFVLKRCSGVRTDTKTSLTSAHCPNCGAPEGNSDSSSCEYCGTVMNDGKKEWVLEAVLTPFDNKLTQAIALVRDADRGNQNQRAASADDGEYVKRNYTVSDYASAVYSIPASAMVKWMVAMMLADGQIDSNEIKLIYDLGGKRGISRERIDSLITEIRTQNSPVEYVVQTTDLPMDEELMRAVLRIAFADGKLAKGEIELLRFIGKKMNMPEERIKKLMTEERLKLFRMSKAVINESRNL